MNAVRHDDDYHYLFKIILIGDAGVGKTHILSRYIKGTLPKNKFPTIGVEFATKIIPIKEGKTVKAQIWDTAGQERFKAITSAHYRKSVGALIVYDITNEESFYNVKRWMSELKENAEPDIVIVLVGNKVDLIEADPKARKVQTKDAQEFADKHGLLFGESSAIADVNVKDVFEKLLHKIYENKSAEDVDNIINKKKKRLIFDDKDNSKSESCCPI